MSSSARCQLNVPKHWTPSLLVNPGVDGHQQLLMAGGRHRGAAASWPSDLYGTFAVCAATLALKRASRTNLRMSCKDLVAQAPLRACRRLRVKSTASAPCALAIHEGVMSGSQHRAFRLCRELFMDLVDRIEALFARHGQRPYDGARREAVTALEHALQCAQLAEWAHAEPALVAASLLHDVGHFIDTGAVTDRIDDVHEMRAVPLLAEAFGAAVVEPVRLHVQAKRYLVATDRRYRATLSPASVHSLDLQGGAMVDDEVRLFEALPHAIEAVALRRWDDQAKQAGRKTPPLGYYLPLLKDLMHAGAASAAH
jgi:phosphonate degradation associated HDIG domain protein